MIFLFALLAGIFSTLSPCVLPLLPFILAGASNTRGGVLALSFGLALSFSALGIFIATIGFSIGLDGDFFKRIIALFLIFFGLAMIFSQVSDRVTALLTPLTRVFETKFANQQKGQFLLGAGLGVVWSPCVGPTLGAASLLAAKSESLPQVFITMLVFGFGAALPLILLSFLSRETMNRLKVKLMNAGRKGKLVLGVILLLLGASFYFGLDKQLEGYLVQLSPVWLTNLTTKF